MRCRFSWTTLLALAVLAAVVLFRAWCDLWRFPPSAVQTFRIHNERVENVTLYHIGTAGEASPWPAASWTIGSGRTLGFQGFSGTFYLCTAPSGWWSFFAVPPGWTDYHITGDNGAGGIPDILLTPDAVLRSAHSVGLYPWFPVRLVNHNRRFIKPVIAIFCLIVVLHRDWKQWVDRLVSKKTLQRNAHRRQWALAFFSRLCPRIDRALGLAALGYGEHKSRRATWHDSLKALALGPMILDHIGRLVIASGDNTWWNASSKFVSTPIFFFLMGGGAVQRPVPSSLNHSMLRILTTYVVLDRIMHPNEFSSVLLQHVMASVLFSSFTDFPHWPLPLHCLVACAFVVLHPVLIMGLQFGSGGAGFLYAGAGATCLGKASRGKTHLWLLVGQVVRTLTVFHFEFAPNARQSGWAHSIGPTMASLAALPVQWWMLAAYRRGPLPEWMPGWLTNSCRWTSRWALEIYGAHLLAIYAAAWWLGNLTTTDFML